MSTYICALLLCLAVSTFADTDLDKTCSTDVDCPDHSHCLYRYQGVDVCANDGCFCDEGYFANGNVCTQKKEIGESCSGDVQCTSTTIGSRCPTMGERICECDTATYGDLVETVDGMKYCYKATLDEGTCTLDTECLANGFGGMECDNTDSCSCMAGYKQSGHKCVRATEGEECEIGQADVDCDTTKNLVCTQDVCVCDASYSWDADHHTCIHDNANQVGNGDDCQAAPQGYENNGEYCPTSHECKTCPGEAGTKCLIDTEDNGASAVTITSTLMVLIGSLHAILV